MTNYLLNTWRDEAVILVKKRATRAADARDQQAKSSFAVVGEQRVVVPDQLTRTEHFRAKLSMAVLR